MNEWAAKRFWKAVTVGSDGDGFVVRLDDRSIKTPLGYGLCVPTIALARTVAAEWAAQEGNVDPRSMPFTRLTNAALDKVAGQKREVADLIADYGASDLICYRAETPETLVERQAAAWDPMLNFAQGALDAPLTVTAGIVPVEQPADSLARLRAIVHAFDLFALTALHDLVTVSGSLVIGLAATRDFLPVEALWTMSRIDEDWQA
ncbi:MAG: ATP12 family protein, partial [Pseudomonadota bacterium]